VAREARKRGVQGVVCGHIHHAEMRDIDGILYCNDGDWVESLTALAERADGTLEIIHWAEHMPALTQVPLRARRRSTEVAREAARQVGARADAVTESCFG
jgi:hypothetical protein